VSNWAYGPMVTKRARPLTIFSPCAVIHVPSHSRASSHCLSDSQGSLHWAFRRHQMLFKGVRSEIMTDRNMPLIHEGAQVAMLPMVVKVSYSVLLITLFGY